MADLFCAFFAVLEFPGSSFCRAFWCFRGKIERRQRIFLRVSNLLNGSKGSAEAAQAGGKRSRRHTTATLLARTRHWCFISFYSHSKLGTAKFYHISWFLWLKQKKNRRRLVFANCVTMCTSWREGVPWTAAGALLSLCEVLATSLSFARGFSLVMFLCVQVWREKKKKKWFSVIEDCLWLCQTETDIQQLLIDSGSHFWRFVGVSQSEPWLGKHCVVVLGII